MAQSKQPFWWGIICALGVASADQLSKWFILTKVMNPPQLIEILPIFDLVLVFNRGISFGMLTQNEQTGVLMLILIALAITIGLLAWLWRITSNHAGIAVGLIIGGAIGNVIDRIRLGSVVDFLHFHWQQYSFPAFNVADSFITIGTGLILLETFLKKEPAKDAA